MKQLITLSCVIVFALSCATAGEILPDSVGSRSCAVAWEAYLNRPSRANGEQLYRLLPNSHDRSIVSDSSSFWTIYGSVWSLKDLVTKEQRIAVRIAFKLFAICDGDFCESLDQILGSLIRINPSMFLEELSNHRSLVGSLGGLVGNLGDEFVDQESKSARERKLRISSLKRVQKASLRSLRDECIVALKRGLK